MRIIKLFEEYNNKEYRLIKDDEYSSYSIYTIDNIKPIIDLLYQYKLINFFDKYRINRFYKNIGKSNLFGKKKECKYIGKDNFCSIYLTKDSIHIEKLFFNLKLLYKMPLKISISILDDDYYLFIKDGNIYQCDQLSGLKKCLKNEL